jgi:hypothetical protein
VSQEPWTDERLDQAFAELVDRPTPADLEEAVMSELRTRSGRGRRWWRGLRPIALLPAAAGIVAIALVGVVIWSGTLGPSATGPSPSSAVRSSAAEPSPSTAPASPSSGLSPSPNATAAGYPSEILGLPVISVSRLLEIGADGTHAEEVFAVGGWYAPSVVVYCPMADRYAPPPLLEIGCGEDTAWLGDRPAALVDAADALHPKFLPGSTWAPAPSAIEGLAPIPVVFLGHVGDARASLCPAETLETCERQFVVDRVAWADGQDVPMELYYDVALAGRAKPSIADAETYVEATLPGATILSVAYLSGETIRRIEPMAGYGGDGALYVLRVIASRPCGPLFGGSAFRWSVPLLFDLAGEFVPTPLSPCVMKPL